MATMKGAAEELIPYRVTVTVNGQLPYDPYFEGQTGPSFQAYARGEHNGNDMTLSLLL